MEPESLQEAILYFAKPANCRDYLVARRWPDGVECPRCGSKNVTFLEKYSRWQCREKHEAPQFTLKTGTIFEDSPIGLDKWLTAMWMVVNCKNGVSTWEVHRALKITQKTAWFVLHRVRLALRSEMGKLAGPDGGPVEVDEMFVGGAKRFMHASKKERFSRNQYDNKAAVVGFLDRELRRVRTKVVPNIKRETLQNEVLNNIHPGSQVYTDSASAYDRWRDDFVHEIVNKAESYVRGQVHVNTLENFWSCAKRTLKGTYIAVEPFHLDRYLDEQIFRFENRATKDNPLNDADRFDLAVRQVVGKRLTYSELTGKEGETSVF
jgi:transposase-like protein